MMNQIDAAERFAIADVLSRYARGADERDLALYADCFTSDVVIEGFGNRTYTGRDPWVAYVEKALAGFRATQHLLGPQLVSVNGDEAEVRTDVQATHELLEPAGALLILWATYYSRMRREDGVWRIAHHRIETRMRRTIPAVAVSDG